jgi:hypothetical protein
MDDTPELRVERVPMLDTGLGREAGYANDKELIAAAAQQRAEMAFTAHARGAKAARSR